MSNVVGAMIGLQGVALPTGLHGLLHWRLVQGMTSMGVSFGGLPMIPDYHVLFAWIVALWSLAWLAPNSQQLLADYRPALEQVVSSSPLRWRPNAYWFACVAVGLLYAAMTMGGKVSEFLYFQF